MKYYIEIDSNKHINDIANHFVRCCNIEICPIVLEKVCPLTKNGKIICSAVTKEDWLPFIKPIQ